MDPKSNRTGVLQKRRETNTQGRRPREDGGTDWSNLSIRQRLPRINFHEEEARKDLKGKTDLLAP